MQPCNCLSTTKPNTVRRARHRAWTALYGPIPQGKLLLRSCNSPTCIEPTHLYIGTARDSARDMVRRRRHVGNTRHSSEMIAAIRAATGLQRDIAQRFNVSQGYVSLIRRGKMRPST